jgi:hypothetical protein
LSGDTTHLLLDRLIAIEQPLVHARKVTTAVMERAAARQARSRSLIEQSFRLLAAR